MPNGGYPIWMQLSLTAEYALRFKASEVWLVTKEGERWVNVHQIPPKAIRAMLYHLAYWGISESGESWRGTKFLDERIEPWKFTNGWCLYDY